MEHAFIEISLVEDVVSQPADVQLRELSDIQLAIVGGGCGEVTLV